MLTTALPGTSRRMIAVQDAMGSAYATLPYSLRVMAENALRQTGGEDAVKRLTARAGEAVPFRPSRLLLQDMLGLPLLVDMMAMRDRVVEAGGDPGRVDMSLPVDLVIDHAMTITHWAEKFALERNMQREFAINHERFAFIKACEARFPRLRVIPPGGGIMHQVNLEYLGQVVQPGEHDSDLITCDTNLGTDSHTPMINALGVLGWGIGGLEAEAIIFGEATMVNVPKVMGLELTGAPDSHITATDMALTIAEKLRARGVVDCFVELFGDGYKRISVADRSTIANMSPEYGSTSVFCPVDDNTLRYLRETGRRAEHTDLVETFQRAQAMWCDDFDSRIEFDDVLTLDLGSIRRSVSGPSRPEQRMDLSAATNLVDDVRPEQAKRVKVSGQDHTIGDGDVIIAAITSCTNTANPRHMVLAGLLARKARAKGLVTKPHVKTSLAPGSRVVAHYLQASGLQDDLDALGFHLAAFSCSTCNGMSGPLTPAHEAAIRDHDLKTVAVLSGNRNFAGRIHPLAARNLLASPPLVVAYALAGTVFTDISKDALGMDREGCPVTLDHIWPVEAEVQSVIEAHLHADDFATQYAAIETVNPAWNDLDIDTERYDWPGSTYVTFPPFIRSITREPAFEPTMKGLRPLVILGDSVTTDHISPSGAIVADSDAGRYLIQRGVAPEDFNSYGTRRGSSDIVIRSTFANLRLRNEMTPDHEGPWTRIEPEGDIVSIHTAIESYAERGQGLVVIGGREYGCGSSRDTAAKAPWLAGIRAVVTESFERIHRSNLVNMGIAPLCFPAGVTRRTLQLDGTETFDIQLADDLTSAQMTIHRSNGETVTIDLDLRLYNDAERRTFRHGGLLGRSFLTFMETEH